MGPARLLQRVTAPDPQVQPALADQGEQVAGASQQLVAVGDEVRERGTGEVDRTGAVEPLRGHRIDRSAGLAEQGQHPARTQRGQARVEGVPTDTVVDGGHALVPGEVADGLDHRGLGVADDLVGARLTGDGLLGVGGDRADHPGASGLGQLDDEQTGAAGGGVHQDGLALGHGVHRVGEVVGGHPLEQYGGGLLVGDVVGNRYEPGGVDHGPVGVAARSHGPADTVARRQGVDPLAQGRDRADGLHPGNVGQRHLVGAGALVDVDEVDASGRHVHQDLTGSGGGIVDLGRA